MLPNWTSADRNRQNMNNTSEIVFWCSSFIFLVFFLLFSALVSAIRSVALQLAKFAFCRFLRNSYPFFFPLHLKRIFFWVDWCYYVSIRIIEICQRLPLYRRFSLLFCDILSKVATISIFAFHIRYQKGNTTTCPFPTFAPINVANHFFRVSQSNDLIMLSLPFLSNQNISISVEYVCTLCILHCSLHPPPVWLFLIDFFRIAFYFKYIYLCETIK